MFKSQTYGQLNIEEIPNCILAFYESHKQYDAPVYIIVGTDSQNFDHTKSVSVIAVVCEGHGGIFFYELSRKVLIRDVRTKLYEETQASLTIAEKLLEILENDSRYEELYFNCPLAIHVDAGNSNRGKTKELIPELVGWIKSCGYDCQIKPDSFVASSIADRLTK